MSVVLTGGDGNDTLDGADTFAFAVGDGHDKIVDFGDGDTISITGVSGGFEGLVIKQDGADTVIHYGDGDSIRLSGVSANLAAGLDLAGRVVTLNAMHARPDTARCLPARRADHVVTAIKDNKAIDLGGAPWHETVDKAHGRLEHRRGAIVDLSGPAWDGYAALHGRRQALRIKRECDILKTGERSLEVIGCLTLLGPARAGLRELLELVRHHWPVENSLHYVHDFPCDEDRCRAHVRPMPRNLAYLTHAATCPRPTGTLPPVPGSTRRGPDPVRCLIRRP